MMDGFSKTDGYTFPTTIVPRVEGNAPENWDPNSYFAEVGVVIKDSPMQILPIEEVLRLRSAYMDKAVKIVRPKAQQQEVPQQVQMVKVQQEPPQPVVDAPKYYVQLKPEGFPLAVSSAYHDILVEGPFIVLVYDMRYPALQQVSDIVPGSRFEMTLLSQGDTYTVVYTGLMFIHNNYRYSIFAVDFPEEENKAE